jgi:hypothetical protein
MNDARYGGGFGGIARDINAAIEHHATATSFSGAIAAGTSSAAVHGDAPVAGSPFATGGLFTAPSPGPFAAPPAAVAFAPPPAPAFAPPPPAAFAPPAFPTASRPPPKTPSIPPAPASIFGLAPSEEPEGIDEDHHVQEVYLQFLAAKQQCGESAAGLTLERFRQRLEENRSALMTKHVCRTVRFSVYVKDGKASLRATPVK